MTTTNLLLIRHGHTDWADRRLSGWLPGIHLTEVGQAQARSLAEQLAGIPLAALFSSPLERALETLSPLAAARGLPIQVRQGLIEAGCGDWAGRTLEDLKNEEMWPLLHVYPGGVRFPNGESLREVQARMVAELDALRDAHAGQTVAAVSHADPLKLAVAHYAGVPLDLYGRLTIHPASVTVLSFTQYGPRLLCLNHTEALPPLLLPSEEPTKDKEP